MFLSHIIAILDNNLCHPIDEFSSQQYSNITQDSISFTTFLTASSTLFATIYLAASSSLTLSSIKLYSFYNEQRLINNPEFIRSSKFNFNSNNSLMHKSTINTSPTQSEIVSITGALIVFTVLLAIVLITHLFDAIDDFRRKWSKWSQNFRISSLLNIGLAKNIQLMCLLNQLILDLLITVVLKSTLLTNLFVDERSLKLNKKLNYDKNQDFDDHEKLDRVDKLLSNDEEEDEEFFEKRKWSTWFAGQLRQRLIQS